MRRMVFVVGCQRSGTTLTGQILGAHPNAVLIDEPDGSMRWMRATFESGASPTASLQRWRSLRSARANYKNPRERFTLLGRVRKQISHLILKSPNLTFFSRQIAARYPGSPVVYLVRDVRDVVASVSHTRPEILESQTERIRARPELFERFPKETELLFDPGTPAYARTAAMAVIKMSLGEDFQRVGLPTMRVRYEDLVSEPQRWVPRLLAHVGLPVASEPLAHHRTLDGVGPGGTLRSRAIDTDSMGRWRTALTSAQVEVINGITQRFAPEG